MLGGAENVGVSFRRNLLKVAKDSGGQVNGYAGRCRPVFFFPPSRINIEQIPVGVPVVSMEIKYARQH